MNPLSFTFEPSAWEVTLDGLRKGASLSASRFLALMSELSEEEVETALADLDEKDILLDIRDLPKIEVGGDTGLRLRTEQQLAEDKKLPEGLEQGDPLRVFLEEVAATPVCGDAQVLAEQYRSGDRNAAGMLTSLLLNRVIDRAFQLTGKGVLLLDLIQEGSLGLWQGILSYEQGDIEAHCDRCVERTMAKTIAMQARENGVGQKMRQAMEDYQAADNRLLTQLGRNPTVEEIAAELHMTFDEASAVEEMLESARMLNRAEQAAQPKAEEENDNQAVEDTAYFQLRQRISDLLGSLDVKQAQLLSLRFGLDGGLPMSPEETGKKLGLTPSEVLAAESAALAKLRREG